MATRFFCFASVSSVRIWSRKSRYVGSARAACDSSAVQALGDRAEAQLHQPLLDTSANELAHDTPPITAA